MGLQRLELTVLGLESAIARATPGERLEFQDTKAPRLYARVTRNGAIFSVLQQRRTDGRKATNRQTLGRFARDEASGLTLEAARKQANAFAVQVDHGIAPVNIRRQPAPARPVVERAVPALTPGASAALTLDDLGPMLPGTFGALAVKWIEFALPKLRKPRSYVTVLRSYLLPYWRHVPVKLITREVIVERLDAIARWGSDSAHMRAMRADDKRHEAGPAPTQADRTGALISTMFQFALDRGGWFERGAIAHPAFRLPKYALSPVKQLEHRADDYLRADELVAFWQACAAEKIAPLVALALWTEVLTGQRGQEVLGMRWDELTYDRVPGGEGLAEWWTIPGERTKNHRTHPVPVTPMLSALLAAIRASSPNPVYVFPTFGQINVRRAPGAIPQATAGPLTHETSSYRSAKARIFARAGLSHRRPHDFRRTVETHLTGLGVSEEHRDAVLNHKRGSSVGRVHYQRWQFAAEKRAALEAWHGEIARLLRAAKVMPAAPDTSRAAIAAGASARLLPFPAGPIA